MYIFLFRRLYPVCGAHFVLVHLKFISVWGSAPERRSGLICIDTGLVSIHSCCQSHPTSLHLSSLTSRRTDAKCISLQAITPGEYIYIIFHKRRTLTRRVTYTVARKKWNAFIRRNIFLCGEICSNIYRFYCIFVLGIIRCL